MKKIYFCLILVNIFILSSCQQLDELPLSSSKELSSLKCVLQVAQVKNGVTTYIKTEINLTTSDNIEDVKKGNIRYVMNPAYTQEDYSRARFEAIIPVTAKIIEKDALGNVISQSVGFQRNVYNKVFYYYVVAANGEEMKYTVRFTTE